VKRINVDGVRNVATAALEAGVKRMVHFSSCHAFDLRRANVDETCPRPGPDHPAYDRSKAAGEAALREIIAQGLDAVIVNPSGVIGPLDFKPSRMGQAFLDLKSGRLPSMLQGGFDFVDVRDVVASAFAAEQKGQTGHNYLLGGGWRPLPELLGAAALASGARLPRFTSPMWLAERGAPFLTTWAQLTGAEPLYTREALHALKSPPDLLDCGKAVAELGHSVRPLEQTLRDVYTSFDAMGR
jgi:dihydroflavonol-4-reductase